MAKVVRLIMIVAFVVGLTVSPGRVVTVSAQDEEIGYLWNLSFDFESDFNGVLTIEVGPWVDGDLASVNEASTTRVSCTRVGNVSLSGGDAVFGNGGYLSCHMDLGEIVRRNHGLHVEPVDDYGSIVLRTRVNPVPGPAPLAVPIFTHPDAAYKLSFPTTSSVDMQQQLWNGVGPINQNFGSVSPGTWTAYTFYYGCSSAGPCFADFQAGGQTANQGVPGGTRVNWSTGPVDFEIGRNGGDTFQGRMSDLFIDPGNSAH